jgi:DNA-binding XRE family transcriptional regulator
LVRVIENTADKLRQLRDEPPGLAAKKFIDRMATLPDTERGRTAALIERLKVEAEEKTAEAVWQERERAADLIAKLKTRQPKAKRASPVKIFCSPRLKELREERGLTQERLADLIGIKDPRHLRGLENGERSTTMATINTIAEVLGCLPGELVGRTDVGQNRKRTARF